VSIHRFLKRTGQVLGASLVGLVVVLLLGEGGLRLAARFARDRATDWRPQASRRVLCVGDSHTYGFMVPPGESYPAYLQEFLDHQAPGVYSVINLGIPGMNTTQVRNRLPMQVANYQPDVVVVWCGANNAWNHAEVDDGSSGMSAWLEPIVGRSRLYRFTRVWLHDLWLERDFQSLQRDLRSAATGRIPEPPQVSVDDPWSLSATFTVRHWDGSKDRISNREGERLPETVSEQQAVQDFAAIAAYAARTHIKLVFVVYPTELPAFAFANRAARATAMQYGAGLVDSAVSLERVPPEDRKWLPAVHPSGAIYREIARDVAAAIVGQDPAATAHTP